MTAPAKAKLTTFERQVLGAVARQQGMTPDVIPLERIVAELRAWQFVDPKRAFITYTLAGLVRSGHLSHCGTGWRVERLA